jgi:rho GTPase-activating protein RICH2, putative
LDDVIFVIFLSLFCLFRLTDSNSRLQAFWQVCNCLPKVNHTNLRYLIRFLAKYAANCESNKMTPQNIAIAIAPSLIWAPSVNGKEYALGANMTAANHHTMIVEALVNYADWFFPGGGLC